MTPLYVRYSALVDCSRHLVGLVRCCSAKHTVNYVRKLLCVELRRSAKYIGIEFAWFLARYVYVVALQYGRFCVHFNDISPPRIYVG